MVKKVGFVLLGGLVLAASAVLLQPPQVAAQAGVDYEAIAQKLVNQCAAIREGEFVYINGGAKDLELLEDIAVQVRKIGGIPLLTFGSDRLTRRMWTEVPEKYDAQGREPWVKLLGLLSAMINVSYNEDNALLSDIPAGRLAASNNADAAINDVLQKNNCRGVSLGNGLYPTVQLALRYGLSKDELARIFWDCINLDYTELQKRCEAVKSVLAAGNELHITHPNGTNFKVRVAGRPVLFSDGVISAEDIKSGFAASQVYLPAGEVFVTPIPGTAEGKIVVDKDYNEGKEIIGWTLVFKAGKLVSMSAKSGLERLQAFYDAAGAGKDEFAYVDLGVNPKLGADSPILNWVRSGMITIGTGNNVWAGGSNSSPFGLSAFLPGCTLKVDRKPLIDKGKLLR